MASPDDLESALPPWQSALPALLERLNPLAAERLNAATTAVATSPNRRNANELLVAMYAIGSPAVYTALNSATWLMSQLRITAEWSVRDIACHAISRMIHDMGGGRVACESGMIWIDQRMLLEPMLDLETDPSGRWVGQHNDPHYADLADESNPRRAFVSRLLDSWKCEPEARAWLHCRGNILTVPAVGISIDHLLSSSAGEDLVRAVADTVMCHPTVASAGQRPWWTAGWSANIASSVARIGASGLSFRALRPWLRAPASPGQTTASQLHVLEAGLYAFAPHHTPSANLAAALRQRVDVHLGDLLRDLGHGWMAYSWESPRGEVNLPIILRDDGLDTPLYPLAPLVRELVDEGDLPAVRSPNGELTCSVHAALRGGLVHLVLRDEMWLVAPPGCGNPEDWYVVFSPTAPLPRDWSPVPDRLAWEAYITPAPGEAA